MSSNDTVTKYKDSENSYGFIFKQLDADYKIPFNGLVEKTLTSKNILYLLEQTSKQKIEILSFMTKVKTYYSAFNKNER